MDEDLHRLARWMNITGLEEPVHQYRAVAPTGPSFSDLARFNLCCLYRTDFAALRELVSLQLLPSNYYDLERCDGNSTAQSWFTEGSDCPRAAHDQILMMG